jgi:hypothetical protein
MPLPNSLPWMESVDAKMIRAHENIFELAREINEWFASITINIYLKNAPHLPNPWMVAVASDYVPPVRLSVLLGECIHNMRSAVDNLVCGLVRTTKPRSKCSGLAFPMLKDANEWDRKTDQKVKGVPDAAIATIKQLQPHPTCQGRAPDRRPPRQLAHCRTGKTPAGECRTRVTRGQKELRNSRYADRMWPPARRTAVALCGFDSVT